MSDKKRKRISLGTTDRPQGRPAKNKNTDSDRNLPEAEQEERIGSTSTVGPVNKVNTSGRLGGTLAQSQQTT